MRTARRTAAVVAATLLAGLPAATAAASAEDARATQTLSGTWYQVTERLTDTTCAATTDVTGRWSVTLKKDGTANLSLAVLIHGRLHAAWGGQATGARAAWSEAETGYVLRVGSDPYLWTFAVDGNDVTFTIPNRYPGCDPSTGTLLGTVR